MNKRCLVAVASMSTAFSALLIHQANAAGFALIEQSVSGLGNAFAGGAAAAEDASTIYYNPAGLSNLNSAQTVGGIHWVRPTFTFRNNGSTQSIPALNAAGGNGGDAGSSNYIPNFYISAPMTDRISLGLGVNAPFGLKTEYDPSWAGRFQAIKSDIKAINFNPTASIRVNDQVSVGVGFNAQHFDAMLTSAVNYSAAIARTTSGLVLLPGLEGQSKVKGKDWGYGFNVGLMWNIDPTTRVGLSYRSKIKYRIEGTASFVRPTSASPTATAIINGATPDGPVDLAITMPDSAALSAFKSFGAFDLMADVTWTGWSVLKNLDIYRRSGALLSHTPENFRDSWRFSAGGNWHVNEALTLKAGLAWDQSPVRDDFRTARLPDEDRTWLSGGLQYQLTPAVSVAAAFTHIWVKSATIRDDLSASGAGLLSGSYKSHVNIASVQAAWQF